ncbi:MULTISPECIES: pilus assembly protein TadG-related protein [unclassified Streptomyces]|uniref:Tad domain-containing protein n=1 Tax=unclassified Streptomyces TaxID=2593676 RepID=UPI0036F072C4
MHATRHVVRRLVGRVARRVVRRPDRGSGTAAMLIFAVVFMALAAFVVDGGLSISKRERAADIAEQAARYAAQDIDVEALRNAPAGTQPVINTGACTGRVRNFAEQSGLSPADVMASYCTSALPNRVEVTVQLTYEPMLTGFFYDHNIVVHGTAAAESVTGPAN